MTLIQREMFRLHAWGTIDGKISWLQRHGLDPRLVTNFQIDYDHQNVIAYRPELGYVVVPLKEKPACKVCVSVQEGE